MKIFNAMIKSSVNDNEHSSEDVTCALVKIVAHREGWSDGDELEEVVGRNFANDAKIFRRDFEVAVCMKSIYATDEELESAAVNELYGMGTYHGAANKSGNRYGANLSKSVIESPYYDKYYGLPAFKKVGIQHIDLNKFCELTGYTKEKVFYNIFDRGLDDYCKVVNLSSSENAIYLFEKNEDELDMGYLDSSRRNNMIKSSVFVDDDNNEMSSEEMQKYVIDWALTDEFKEQFHGDEESYKSYFDKSGNPKWYKIYKDFLDISSNGAFTEINSSRRNNMKKTIKSAMRDHYLLGKQNFLTEHVFGIDDDGDVEYEYDFGKELVDAEMSIFEKSDTGFVGFDIESHRAGETKTRYEVLDYDGLEDAIEGSDIKNGVAIYEDSNGIITVATMGSNWHNDKTGEEGTDYTLFKAIDYNAKPENEELQLESSHKSIKSSSMTYQENEMPPEMKNKTYWEIYYYNEGDDKQLGSQDKYDSDRGMSFIRAKQKAKQLMKDNDCNMALMQTNDGDGIIIKSDFEKSFEILSGYERNKDSLSKIF